MIEMAEESPLNSTNQVDGGDSMKNAENSIKVEEEVMVKPEPQECVVCSSQACDNVDICATKTGSGTLLTDFLCKFTDNDLATNSSRHVCKSCHDLINVLEQAELEYLKLKEAFEAIISKNPLFDQSSRQPVGAVKSEVNDNVYGALCDTNGDSEDEPLAVTKKKRRKVDGRKKKVCATQKRKTRAKNSKTSWKETNPVVSSYEDNVLKDVKKEDSMDGSEGSQLNGLDSVFKIEVAPLDDDDELPDFGDDYGIEEPKRSNVLVSRSRKSKALTLPKIRKKRENKVMHQCDQCDAKYTSIRRLELHLEKHSLGKPPYICEVCGARYKHKRACDIHVALHKGISDWKCEECNKLFPSKGALQRHNNIHTGKLNYQCDLCGKSFIHTSSFKMHKLSHSGVKPHACDVCGLALMTRSHLKRHARVHSGEKRHECRVCGKRFSERYNLAAHTKAHEGQGELPPGLPQPPRRRLFRCSFCPERFERRYLLERHCSQAHGRPLERAPPTPRNTMSKLLKAQARQAGAQAESAAAVPKEERSPDSRASSVTQKLQLASPAPPTAASWADAFQAGFGLRSYPH